MLSFSYYCFSVLRVRFVNKETSYITYKYIYAHVKVHIASVKQDVLMIHSMSFTEFFCPLLKIWIVLSSLKFHCTTERSFIDNSSLSFTYCPCMHGSDGLRLAWQYKISCTYPLLAIQIHSADGRALYRSLQSVAVMPLH